MPRKCGGVQKMTNMRYEYAYTETLNLQFRAGWFNLGWNKLFEGWLVGWLVSQRGVCGFEVWRKARKATHCQMYEHTEIFCQMYECIEIFTICLHRNSFIFFKSLHNFVSLWNMHTVIIKCVCAEYISNRRTGVILKVLLRSQCLGGDSKRQVTFYTNLTKKQRNKLDKQTNNQT